MAFSSRVLPEMVMARLSSPSLQEDENGHFLPLHSHPNHSHSPNGSSASSGATSRDTDVSYDILSTSRETEASGVTPTRPLLVAKQTNSLVNGRHNGLSKAEQLYGENHNIKAKRKRKHFWKGKEHICCLVGTVLCLIGAIFVCIGLILFVNSRTAVSPTPHACGLSHELDSTVSSPGDASVPRGDVTQRSSTTTTQATSTVNYGE